MQRTFFLLSALALSAVSAFAVDGQTLLNQATINAAGGIPLQNRSRWQLQAVGKSGAAGHGDRHRDRGG
jgi:hypothetical protein